MMKHLLLMLICVLPLAGRAQITAVGLRAGLHAVGSNEFSFSLGNGYSVYWLNINDIGLLNFGLLVEHRVGQKLYFAHTTSLLQYYPSYLILGSNTGMKRLTSGIFAINYNLAVRVFNKSGIRLLGGASIDFNKLSYYRDPTFRDDNLNKIVNAMEEVFNPVVFYAGAELGYRAGRVDMSVKYNHSLNSLTGAVDYQGQNYPIPTRQAFIFFNLGFLIYNRDLRKTQTVNLKGRPNKEKNHLHLNNWRTMGGFSLYGNEDVTGFTLVNEYLRYLTPHIKVGPNLKFSSVGNSQRYKVGLNAQEDTFLDFRSRIYEIGAMGYYEYLNPDRNGLEIGVGVFYRHLQNTVTTGPDIEYVTSDIQLPESSIGQYSQNTVGFNVYMGFIVNISQAINLNLGGLVQGDTEGNGGFGAFGGLTVAF